MASPQLILKTEDITSGLSKLSTMLFSSDAVSLCSGAYLDPHEEIQVKTHMLIYNPDSAPVDVFSLELTDTEKNPLDIHSSMIIYFLVLFFLIKLIVY